jgi:hypothetical protein
VITVDEGGRVERWAPPDFQQRELIAQAARFDSFPLTRDDVRFSAAGSLLAIGHRNGMVQVWDCERRSLAVQFKAAGRRVLPIGFLEQGRKLVVRTPPASGGATYHEWDWRANQATKSWEGPPNFAAFSPDEHWCLMLGGGRALLRDLADNRELDPGISLKPLEQSPVYSRDGRLLVTTNQTEGVVVVRDATTYREIATLTDFLQGSRSPAFSPDSQRLAVASTGIEAVQVWDTTSLEKLLTLPGEGPVFHDTIISPDGELFAAKNAAGILHIWRAPSWREIGETERVRNKQP